MQKEVTIIYRDGSDVGLGVLDQVGRRFYHVRFIKNAGQGGTELADKAVEIPIGDVEIVDGYDYMSLIAFQDRNRAILEWRGRRQVIKGLAQVEAMEGVEKKVLATMRKWDKENPEPTAGKPHFINTGTTETVSLGSGEPDPGPETQECVECGMFGGYHGVDCSHAEPDEPDDPINTDEPPEDEQEPLTNFQRPADAPTEEEAQETAVGEDVDVPF